MSARVQATWELQLALLQTLESREASGHHFEFRKIVGDSLHISRHMVVAPKRLSPKIYPSILSLNGNLCQLGEKCLVDGSPLPFGPLDCKREGQADKSPDIKLSGQS